MTVLRLSRLAGLTPMNLMQRVWRATACTALMLAGVAAAGEAPGPSWPEEKRWLDRVTWGATAADVDRYRALGREAFLAEQLQQESRPLPDPVQRQLEQAEFMRLSSDAQIALFVSMRDRLKNASGQRELQQALRQELYRKAGQNYNELLAELVLRAAYSPTPLQEKMTWFWLNHFSVFHGKSNVKWLLPSHVNDSIRPHALGNFRQLVLATVKSPAMLSYLDNNANAAGAINENYARELLELHTLGVGAGYTQEDVQQLARVLTGVGLRIGRPSPANLPGYVREGVFEFDPRRHAGGDKRLLGKTIPAGGFDEVERAIDIIVSHPACARFVARKLATYFVADEPPPALVTEMEKTFRATDGDIAAVVRTMLLSPQLTMSPKFKDPTHFVVSYLRLLGPAFIGKDPDRPVTWLRSLGQMPFGRLTPDGYPVESAAWNSAGQLLTRFEIAEQMAALPTALPGSAQKVGLLFDPGRSPPPVADRGMVVYRQQASLPLRERNRLFLSSPEFNYY